MQTSHALRHQGITQIFRRNILLTLALSQFAFCYGCTKNSAQSVDHASTSVASTPVVAINLTKLDGGRVGVADLLGEVATVTIFARSDCPISNRYAPELKRLYSQYASQGIRFYHIYVDQSQAADEIRAHLAEYEYPFDGLWDENHQFVRVTGATVTPEAVVLDAQGEMIYRGRIDDQYADFGIARSEPTTRELDDVLAALVEGKQVAFATTEAVGCYIGDLE